MFLGMDLPALDLPNPWDTYAMIGFVAWHVGTDVLLEIHSYCLIRKGTNLAKLLLSPCLLSIKPAWIEFQEVFFGFHLGS